MAADRERDGLERVLLERLSTGGPVSRAELLDCAATAAGRGREERRLRAQVARTLRRLEQEGTIVDGGPEVWLAGADRADAGHAE